jgi:hypothetical protein
MEQKRVNLFKLPSSGHILVKKEGHSLKNSYFKSRVSNVSISSGDVPVLDLSKFYTANRQQTRKSGS